ncbi:GNAT family N-acetyltransferase [Demequina capsici]|uniref:GNAT family N-acetyltransferase n=1 Tax=Demequina capsici TaxID=3075620 RepID=A0AA96FD98_9MICO|nr:GNAT family N-acetyltransferase [Demequina sp. PMTSA13]WNM26456.1 GNAT family N-acetyltransferase [Demequina sp. PMTSA13]
MTAPAGYRLVSFDETRADEMLSAFTWGFAQRLDDSGREEIRAMFPWERARGVEVADSSRGRVGMLAGVRSTHAMELRVPGGGTLPAAGLTWVSVHPSHRRRGVLSTMMRDHFARARARGQAVSVLYAAETAIYGRFGYGAATPHRKIDLGRAPRLREVPGSEALAVRLESADVAVHGDAVRAVQRRLTRPGSPVELGDTMVHEVFSDPLGSYRDAEQTRIAIVEDSDGPAAFAVFRRTMQWGETGAAGRVDVHAWGAVDARATRRLFEAVADMDLMASCHVVVGGDETLLGLLDDVRGVGLKERDGMWLRVLDVEAALTGRTYATDIDLVIGITDALLPTNDGAWRLTASADNPARIERTDASCDIRMDVSTLSTALLGGTSLTALHAVARVEECTPGAVRRASRAFRSDQHPSCNLMF